MIITIDGPAASGKSTVCRALAKYLGYFYLYSGVLFRAVAYLLINKHGYTIDQMRFPNPVDVDAYLDPERFVYRYDDQFQERVFFDGEDITPKLKESIIDDASSLIAQDKHVRSVIASQQHHIAKEYDVITEGRDMGTVVFPDADIKFYLTADLEVRAERWRKLQAYLGTEISSSEAKELIEARDARDMQRELSPLRVPKGAITVDNSTLDAQQTVQELLSHIEQHQQSSGTTLRK